MLRVLNRIVSLSTHSIGCVGKTNQYCGGKICIPILILTLDEGNQICPYIYDYLLTKTLQQQFGLLERYTKYVITMIMFYFVTNAMLHGAFLIKQEPSQNGFGNNHFLVSGMKGSAVPNVLDGLTMRNAIKLSCRFIKD